MKIVFFTLLGLGAAALVAEQPSLSAPVQQPGANQPGANQTATPPSPVQPPGAPPARIPPPSAYPVRPPADPAEVMRGRQIFSANCSFCHGSDARGGEGGPNLIRSELVLDDKQGELITPVVQNGRPDKGMPKFDLTTEEISTIAAFIHSMPVGGRAATTGTVDPLVGDAKAGEAYFNGPGKCTTCHSVTGRPCRHRRKICGRQGPARRNAVRRKKRGVIGSSRKTVTVTLRTGQTVEGQLDQIDDFIVSLTDANGVYRSFPRQGDFPKVVVKDPLQPHLDMLRTFKDEDIHNLTAYLVTLK